MDLNFLKTMFETLALFSAAVLIITDWIRGWTKAQGAWVQAISWIVAIGAAVIGYLAPYGLFIEFTEYPSWQGWLYTGGIAVGTAFIANGLATYEVVSKTLQAIRWLFELFVPKKKTK